MTHDAVKTAGDKLGCFSPHTAKFLSFETLNKGWERLHVAGAAGADWPMPESIEALANKKNVTRLNEWHVGFGALEKALERARE